MPVPVRLDPGRYQALCTLIIRDMPAVAERFSPLVAVAPTLRLLATDCIPMELSFLLRTRKLFSAFLYKVPVPCLVVEVTGRVIRELKRLADDIAVLFPERPV